jgi:hypothetical protein
MLVQRVWQSVGYALWQIQELETTLAMYLVMVHKLEPGVAREEAESVFEKTRKKTLGQLLHDLRTQQAAPANLVARLDQFVDERNWLAHRSRAESRRQLYNPAHTHLLLERLNRIGEDALSLMKDLQAGTEAYLATQGISRDRIDDQMAAVIQEWTGL